MKPSELIARLMVAAGLIMVVGVPITLWRGTSLVHARMPEAGGWSPDSLKATVGVPLRLRITSDDVVHGFAVGHLDMPPADVLPGKVTEVTLNFRRPGVYTFYCTRWCGPNHWRMRGVIEVEGEPGAEMVSDEPGAPLYAALGLDLDAPREAPVIPPVKPLGLVLEGQPAAALAPYASLDYYRSHAPAELWLQLRRDRLFNSFDDQELWQTTASIWRSNTTPASLSEGARLFAANCAACHGSQGAGDGVFADDLEAGMPQDSALGDSAMLQRPADLTLPARMLAASPALLHGKILRGGMGTGMPSWGPILTEQQAWNIVAYLYSFQFEYR